MITTEKTIAARIKYLKSIGVVQGLKDNVYTAIHMDNLEQYSKHARNPSEALTSTLTVGAQQPMPNHPDMQLVEGVDLLQLNEEDGIKTLLLQAFPNFSTCSLTSSSFAG